MRGDEQVRRCLERFVSGGISPDELKVCVEQRARFRFLDTSERSLQGIGALPRARFTRADVDRQLIRYLAERLSAEELSDWAATLRLSDCFEADESDPSSTEVGDFLDELVSPDAWGPITIDSVIDLRRRLAGKKLISVF